MSSHSVRFFLLIYEILAGKPPVRTNYECVICFGCCAGDVHVYLWILRALCYDRRVLCWNRQCRIKSGEPGLGLTLLNINRE